MGLLRRRAKAVTQSPASVVEEAERADAAATAVARTLSDSRITLFSGDDAEFAIKVTRLADDLATAVPPQWAVTVNGRTYVREMGGGGTFAVEDVSLSHRKNSSPIEQVEARHAFARDVHDLVEAFMHEATRRARSEVREPAITLLRHLGVEPAFRTSPVAYYTPYEAARRTFQQQRPSGLPLTDENIKRRRATLADEALSDTVVIDDLRNHISAGNITLKTEPLLEELYLEFRRYFGWDHTAAKPVERYHFDNEWNGFRAVKALTKARKLLPEVQAELALPPPISSRELGRQLRSAAPFTISERIEQLRALVGLALENQALEEQAVQALETRLLEISGGDSLESRIGRSTYVLTGLQRGLRLTQGRTTHLPIQRKQNDTASPERLALLTDGPALFDDVARQMTRVSTRLTSDRERFEAVQDGTMVLKRSISPDTLGL